jgi:adenosine deaminase
VLDALDAGFREAEQDGPLDALRRAGVRVSINTDDPSLLGTTLPREYALCQSCCGWDDTVVRDLAATSIDTSFADEDTKRRLTRALAAW